MASTPKRPTRMPVCERILYGADYNPDQWLHDQNVLLEDIALMRKVDATSMSIGIFSWTALEPAPGVFTFTWLDETMDRMARAGLRVFLATPSGSKPMWLSELHPEVRRVSRDGRREPSGGRHNHCPTSPVYRDAVRRINRELALRYGKHPALALWHVGNELSGDCHCDLCKTAFHDWLRHRYVSLDVLNRAWWTAFWNHTFTDWSQIPTFDRSIDGLAVDWLRFVNDQHCSFLETEMAPLREIVPAIPCTTNFMGTNQATNYWQWARSLDCISNDLYPLPEDRGDTWRKSLGSDFIHSLMRGIADGDPWILMECAPSSVNWAKVNKLKRPGVHLQEILQAVANGADVIHYFQWRKSRGGYEKFHGAVVDHVGTPDTRVFNECAEVGRILKTLAPVAGLRPDRAPVAMVYDWESRWALHASCGPKSSTHGDRHTEACHEHFAALRTAGVDVDILSPEADFSAYRVVVTPVFYSISPRTAARLTAFVASGGTWIATYLTGYVDTHNRCWLGGFPGPGLREVFGLWNEEIDYLFDDEKIRVDGTLFGPDACTHATDIVERLHARGARILATLGSDFYAGSPVILQHQHGLGNTLYVGARLAPEGCAAFYTDLATRLDVARRPLPRGVVAKTRNGADGPVDFLFNYNRSEVTVDLGTDHYIRIADGATSSGKTTLRPYETLVKGVGLAPATPPLDALPSTLPAMKTHTPRHPVAAIKAFTLIELLTVIAIIGILAALVIPTVGAVRKSASSAKALSNAKQIGMSNLLYAQDNKNQLMGQNDTWTGTEFMFNNMTRYIAKAPAGNELVTINTLRTLVDPLVPEEFQNYGQYPYTWAINRLLNLRWGRSFDGTGGGSSVDRPRTLLEMKEPSRTLFAISGGYEITLTNAANAALLAPPTARQAIFYYHKGNNATPAVFLDGHTEMLSFPINPKLLNPRLP